MSVKKITGNERVNLPDLLLKRGCLESSSVKRSANPDTIPGKSSH